MRLLTFLKGLLIYSGFFYGLCATALMMEAYLRQGLGFELVLGTIHLAFGVQLFYGWVYWRSRRLLSGDPRIRFFQQFGNGWLIWMVVEGIAVAYIEYKVWPVGGFPSPFAFIVRLTGLVGLAAVLAYVLPKRFRHMMPPLRQVWWLKPGVIGLCWALASLLPTLLWQEKPGVEALFLFAENLSLVGLLAVLFDLKDEAADRRRGVATIVTRLGAKAAVYRIAGIHLFIYLLIAGLNPQGIGWPLLSIQAAMLIGTMIACLRPQPLSFYLLWVDGQMIVKAIFGALSVYLTQS